MILLVDDNPDDRVLAVRELSREFPAAEITQVASPQGFAEAIGRDGFDLVVTDYQLNWGDGLAVLRAVKGRWPDCPVIMFTASGTEEIAVEAMKEGLDDYIIKAPQHYIRLRGSARAALEHAAARRRSAHLEDRLQGLLDRLRIGVFRATEAGELLDANAAFLRLLGAGDLHEARDLLSRGGVAGAWPLAGGPTAPTDEGEPPASEIEFVRPDGATAWAVVSVARGTAPDGRPIVEGLIEDITTWKRAEAEQARLLGAEQAARREAELAGKAKDRFLAMLSHELRTPLTPVLATVTAMLDEPGTPAEFRSTLELIRRSVELEARLIDDLLDVTRVVHGKMHLDLGITDAHALVHQTLGICRSDLYGKRMRLTLQLGAAAHHVSADAARLQQVLWNLIKNAVKFTPEGGTITIRSRNEEEAADGWLVLEVADTGIGIDSAALPRIFDPFEQGEDTMLRRFGGLGLGLAISRSVAEAHGGRLTAESPGHGRGSVFTLRLPTSEPSADADARPHRHDDRGERRMLRILLVEDDPPSLRVMSRLLQQRGHDVTTADSVAAALEHARGEAFDVLVSDIGLPDGTGLELMSQIQADRPLPGIALSGFGMEEDVRKSAEAGFRAHLTKPVDFQKLEAAIRHVTAQTSEG